MDDPVSERGRQLGHDLILGWGLPAIDVDLASDLDLSIFKNGLARALINQGDKRGEGEIKFASEGGVVGVHRRE